MGFNAFLVDWWCLCTCGALDFTCIAWINSCDVRYMSSSSENLHIDVASLDRLDVLCHHWYGLSCNNNEFLICLYLVVFLQICSLVSSPGLLSSLPEKLPLALRRLPRCQRSRWGYSSSCVLRSWRS